MQTSLNSNEFLITQPSSWQMLIEGSTLVCVVQVIPQESSKESKGKTPTVIHKQESKFQKP